MPRRSLGSLVPTAWALLAAVLLAAPSCVFIVSTAPSTLSGATIIFVAVDDEGILVASLGVRIADVQGDWHQQGVTASDGSFSCGIRSGVSRVRADVSPPAGYVLASKEWPREFDVSGGGSLRVEVRVRSGG